MGCLSLKSMFRKLIVLLVSLVTVMSFGGMSFADEDAYTVLIYLNGTDLESTYYDFQQSFAGNGTKDLEEMIAGYDGNEAINVIVQTGGTKMGK